MNKNIRLFCLILAAYCFGLSGQVLADADLLARVDMIRAPGNSFTFDIHLIASDKKQGSST